MENDFEDGLIILCPVDSARGVRSEGGRRAGGGGQPATTTWRNVAITIVMQSYTFVRVRVSVLI